ncbi:MAG: pyridoxal phosphate-dependent aminotransferase [Candidatus Tyrphobacter sp.]
MNPRVLDISGSMIRRVASRKRASSIDLGLGEPSLPPNPAHFDAAMEYVRAHGIRYTPNAGDPELRAAIAAHYAYAGLLDAGNVCVTVGSQEAMYVTIATLLDPASDELLVIEPTFPSYVKIAALHGITVRTVAMAERDDFAFDAERIVRALGERTRAVVLCSPCNPTGRAISPAQAALLARELERRGGSIALIHDEIYREQCFVERVDFARLYANTIVVGSLSKSNALTGLRLGWILAPAAFVEQAVKVHAWITSCADAFAQRVALHVFQTNALAEHAAWYATRLVPTVAALRASDLRFIAPDGAFYACVELPGGAPSLETALALVDEDDVVTIPGVAFGACLEGWLRLSWVAPESDLHEGLRRIGARCVTSAGPGGIIR